jgi:hypothetical protein
MVAALLVGCGNTEAEVSSDAPADSETPAVSEDVEPAPAEEGKVLNIYCWNEEFKSRVTDHYPGYVEVDGTTGTIGDVTVNWNITPSDDNAYQNNLDETLLGQADAAADEKIDIFLVEADYAGKYVNTDYSLALSELGITDADLANQYKYTQDVVTDANGNLKGSSWQGCPGVLVYNRTVAEEVLGTQDPAAVQEFVKDWATFQETAATMKDAGYYMCSSVNDTYRVYSNNVTSKWVVDGVINIDANLMAWVDNSKEMVDAGYAGTHDLWSDDWNKGFYPDGKVFCYFGPAWLIDFCMAADVEGSVANLGQWGACSGPQGFFWGGTWMCPATGTDNPTLVKDLILTMTANDDVLKEIVVDDNDFTNSKPVMDAMAADTSYSSKVLGGQNALGMFCAGVETIDLSNLTDYDQGCNEEFQTAMKGYFEGTYSKDEAIAAFYTAVVEKYPALTAPQ